MAEGMQDKAENPFSEFTSEEYDGGELIVEEAPVETAAPKAETEPEPVEATADAVETEVEVEEDNEPVAEDKEVKQPPKKTAQERMNELTRFRREAERRAEAAERRAAELEARLNAPPKKEDAAPPKKEEAAEEEDPNAPKATNYEYGELDSRYIRDTARYEANKEFAKLRQQDEDAREQRAAEARQAEARTKFEAMVDRGSKVHEDFYEKVVIASENNVWPLSQEMGELILASEVGNDIAYHLATHVEEADRVYRSSPVEQARYFGRLEAQFSAGQAAASRNGKPAPKTPKAPPPVPAARGAGGQSQATADTDDFLAFEARANSGR